MESAIDIVRGLAGRADAGITTYDRMGRKRFHRSYDELHGRARAMGAALRAAGVGPEEVVFLQLPNGVELVECFLGAIVAGARPCCLSPPRALGGLETYQRRLQWLIEAFPGSHLIAEEATGSRSGQDYFAPPELAADAAVLELPAVAAHDIAFLQLTSGTSRAPKAVRISHGALAANALGILESGRHRDGDGFVSWLPLYHDMGLVGMLVCALAGASPMHLLRPETFAARPLTWLRTLADLPGTGITTAPNFAYQHCVDTLGPEALAGLDLSRWRVAGCGAERVRPQTLEEFSALCAPAGFRPEAFVPCYGMAEATLAVTFESRDAPPVVRDGTVSCGGPLPETEIVIRGPDGQARTDGAVGEITVRSPSLCSGYTGAEEQPPVRDGWLHTGDLGFLCDGALYVTGRLKDTVIIDGQNLDPDEVEEIGERTVRTPGGRCGAFPIDVDGRERVVLAVEVAGKSSDSFAAWAEQIDGEVANLFGFRLRDLVFVRRGELPTTSSGKVRRSVLRGLYENGELAILGRGA